MAKGTGTKSFDKDEQKQSRASLPELLELDDFEDADRAVLLLEEAVALKKELDIKVPDSKAARLEEIKNELTMIQTSGDLPGLRHNNLVFVARLQNGRETVAMKTFVQELLTRGVKVDVIEEATSAARKVGDSFWVRELEVL